MNNATQPRRALRYVAPPAGLGWLFVFFAVLLACAGTLGFFLRYPIAAEVELLGTRTPKPTVPQPGLSNRLCTVLLHDARANRRGRAAELLQAHCLLDDRVPPALFQALGDADLGVERIAWHGLESLKREDAPTETPAWLRNVTAVEVNLVMQRVRDKRVRRGLFTLIAEGNPRLVNPVGRHLLSQDTDIATCQEVIKDILHRDNVAGDPTGPGRCLAEGLMNPNPLIADMCSSQLAACGNWFVCLPESDLLLILKSTTNAQLLGRAVTELDRRPCPDLDAALAERMGQENSPETAVFLVSESLIHFDRERAIALLRAGAVNPNEEVRGVYERSLADRLDSMEGGDGR